MDGKCEVIIPWFQSPDIAAQPRTLGLQSATTMYAEGVPQDDRINVKPVTASPIVAIAHNPLFIGELRFYICSMKEVIGHISGWSAERQV